MATEQMDEPLLTRMEVAQRLGVSQSEIRRREAVGIIKAHKRNAKGWVMFHPDALIGQSGTTPPEKRRPNQPYTSDECASIFDALDAGKTLVQCVRECRVLPETVELIAVAYHRLTGSMHLSKETVDTINALPLEGTFPLKDEKALLEVLQTAAADTCKKCNTRARVLCKPCALKAAERATKDGL